METAEERVKRCLIEYNRAELALNEALDAWEVTRGIDFYGETKKSLGEEVREILLELQRQKGSR